MEKINIEYLKTDLVEEEFEIEQFWLDIRKEIYNIEEDNTLVYYSIRRGHASAYIGEYAGIFFHLVITILPLADATLSIWEKIYNHIKSKREKGKIVRVLNLTLLENLCKCDLIIHKNIKDAELVKSEKLIDKNFKNDDPDIDFPYEDTLNKIDCAKITFKNKKYKYIYIIASDGDITSFERKTI
ncbi:hypothetical protein [Elizabethkingia anophelis]|uniref:hypothetical protein n=2 Tax=Elizabethkingia anophelis TaxID=1117645 RepID=UPI000442CAF7|nr:hypothetical protein [Elizabethkingia anophelis]MCT3846084.1 hypothetical protein [Elizabethkingia anophelis]MDV3597874.1 hypothetical protein [Elizabethkingia anophelis]MVW83790.1 hypothetical protein [Elizabethkingia anophelis]CDN74511.1 hypothetical protein E18064_30008 [Elizabethkingia anophelis]CDN76741.1 hypothetical protein E27107_110008 [Elizabethkingia anophelis]